MFLFHFLIHCNYFHILFAPELSLKSQGLSLFKDFPAIAHGINIFYISLSSGLSVTSPQRTDTGESWQDDEDFQSDSPLVDGATLRREGLGMLII